MDLGLYTEAIEHFKISLQEEPSSFLAEFSIGECYFKMGDFENAIKQFKIANFIEPSHPAPGLFLEQIKLFQGK
jgi:tetratricopeptide (TPR) repeat protein